MKKLKNFLPVSGLTICVVFFLYSCGMNPEFTEKQTPPSSALADQSANSIIGPGLSFPITLNRVDIFTEVSNTLSGTVTM
jgi:hypothetical protein